MLLAIIGFVANILYLILLIKSVNTDKLKVSVNKKDLQYFPCFCVVRQRCIKVILTFFFRVFVFGIHWIALTEYSQMSTYMPGVQSLF